MAMAPKKKKKKSFSQQIRLKFEDETAEVVHLEQSNI
jgi:hypothetical protein